MKKSPDVCLRHRLIKLIIPSFVIFNLSFVILPVPSAAQPKDFTINADKVSLEKDKNRIEAEGSVEVSYKDLFVTGGHIIYDTSEETLAVDNGFTLLYEGVTFEGDKLFYQIEKRSGLASDFKFDYYGIMLVGKDLDLATDRFQLKNVDFTTCDLPQPHYHVTAADVVVYPEYQKLVAYWGFFWLGRFPIVPMPTYIYDLKAGEKDRKNLPPFPEIGSNGIDGTYINENLAWNLNKNISGLYTLSYATNKGVGGGVRGDYIVNERNSGNARLYGNFTDGLYGGATHAYSFGSEVGYSEAEKPILLIFPRRRQFELEADLALRERINYQRVSLTPNITLRSTHGTIIRREARYDLELMGGLVAEEGNTRLLRGGGNLRLFGDFPETAVGYVTPSFTLDQLYYSNGTRWNKAQVGLEMTKSYFSSLSLMVGYYHFLSVEGQSPFLFEMYRFKGVDRLRGEALFGIGETQARVAASYYLDNYAPEDIDYTLFFRLHCYNLEVTYRSLRNEFALGFSLAAK